MRVLHYLPAHTRTVPSVLHPPQQERQRAGESAGLQERLQVGCGVVWRRGGGTREAGGGSSGKVWGQGACRAHAGGGMGLGGRKTGEVCKSSLSVGVWGVD